MLNGDLGPSPALVWTCRPQTVPVGRLVCTRCLGLEAASQFLFLGEEEGARHPVSRGNLIRPLTLVHGVQTSPQTRELARRKDSSPGVTCTAIHSPPAPPQALSQANSVS